MFSWAATKRKHHQAAPGVQVFATKLRKKIYAKYNIKVIRRAMWLLRRKKMSYSEISEGRIVFEVYYCCEDNNGLVATVETVLAALKMIDKVISPSRLSCEIQKQQHIVDVPSRIQLYEFFNLMLLAVSSIDVEEAIKSNSTNLDKEEARSDISLPNFDQLFMTSNQKALQYLDKQYQSSIFKEVKPTSETMQTEDIVSAAPRRELRMLSLEQFRAFSPSLEFSQAQLHQARGRAVTFKSRTSSSVLTDFKQFSPCALQTDVDREDLQSRCTSNKARWQSPQKQSLRHRFVQMSTTANKPSAGERNDRMFNEKGCIKSVLKAREALYTSFSSIPPLTTSSSSSSILVNTPQTQFPESGRPQTAPETTTWSREPIVRPEELQQHQGQIDNLRWNFLRLKPRIIPSRNQ